MYDGLAQSIPATIAEQGPATAPELAAALGAHPATVRRRCEGLQRDGRLRKVTGGAFALADPRGVRVASD